ncbi:MAG: hypothetical protein QM760_19350 [Nibricoccus sp.]
MADGYVVCRNGIPMQGWRWPTDRIDVALAAYRGLIAASEPRPAAMNRVAAATAQTPAA